MDDEAVNVTLHTSSTAGYVPKAAADVGRPAKSCWTQWPLEGDGLAEPSALQPTAQAGARGRTAQKRCQRPQTGGEPELGAPRMGLAVEDAMSAVITGQRIAQIVGSTGLDGLVGLLGLDIGAGQVPVEEVRRQVGAPNHQGGDGAHPDLTAGVVSDPQDGQCRHFGLIDGRHGAGLA